MEQPLKAAVNTKKLAASDRVSRCGYLQVLVSTGGRASEVTNLTRGDVDHGRATVFQVRGKGRKERAVLLDETA